MSNTLKINGQTWDLEASPDLLYDILVSLTNVEQHLNAIDIRLRNLEKKQSPYLINKG